MGENIILYIKVLKSNKTDKQKKEVKTFPQKAGKGRRVNYIIHANTFLCYDTIVNMKKKISLEYKAIPC